MDNLSLYMFLIFLILLIALERRKFKREGIALLRRTDKGIEKLKKIASKYEREINYISDIGVGLSYGILSFYYIFKDRSFGWIRKTTLVGVYALITYTIFHETSLLNDIIKGFFDGNIPLVAQYFLYISAFLFGFGGLAFSILVLGSISVIYSNFFLLKEAQPPLQIVLPFSVPKDLNLPVFSVPFDKWIISIAVIVVVHELAHAIVALANKIRVKSMGYGFLLIIPLGFAEPDERAVKKKPVLQRLRVYAAGSLSNFIFAFIFGLMFLGMGYVSNSIEVHQFQGIAYNGLVNNTFAYEILPSNGTITHINGEKILNFSHFREMLLSHEPLDNITLTIDSKNHTIALSPHPDNSTMPFIGIKNLVEKYEMKQEIKESFVKKILAYMLFYVISLLMWLSILNLGIGIANLLPLIPFDGGLIIKDAVKSSKISRTLFIITLILLIFSLFGNLLVRIFL